MLLSRYNFKQFSVYSWKTLQLTVLINPCTQSLLFLASKAVVLATISTRSLNSKFYHTMTRNIHRHSKGGHEKEHRPCILTLLDAAVISQAGRLVDGELCPPMRISNYRTSFCLDKMMMFIVVHSVKKTSSAPMLALTVAGRSCSSASSNASADVPRTSPMLQA